MNLKPLADRVVIEHVEQSEKSSGGIFLPDTAKEKPQEGIVRAVGTGRVLDNGSTLPMTVKVGDRVKGGATVLANLQSQRETELVEAGSASEKAY